MNAPRDKDGRGLMHRAHKLIQFFLERDTFTRAEVVAFTGLGRDSVDKLFREMRSPGSRLRPRVIDFQVDAHNRRSIPVYDFSPGKDLGRPKPLTGVERTMRWKHEKQRKAQLIAQQAILAMARPTVEEST